MTKEVFSVTGTMLVRLVIREPKRIVDKDLLNFSAIFSNFLACSEQLKYLSFCRSRVFFREDTLKKALWNTLVNNLVHLETLEYFFMFLFIVFLAQVSTGRMQQT